MYPTFRQRLRPIAVIILLSFTWFCIEPWNYAVWAQSTSNQPSSINQGSASKRLEEALRASKDLIEALDQDLSLGKDITKNLESLKGYKKTLEAEDQEIRSEFSQTDAFLKEKGLPSAILDRHAKAISDYESNYNQLKANLDSISRLDSEQKDAEKKKNKAQAKKKLDELKAKIKTTKDYLKEKVKEPPHTPLDPNNLPHRTPKVKSRKPRLKKEEFADLQKPIQLAFNGDPKDLLLVQSNQDLPTAADLAETIEVQFTQEIKDLAASLNHNPVKIYNWVRNNIDFVPTYGSIQGANMCLMTKQCNDMDTASLLIVLLRTSGISARYVIGTIEVPIDKVMNWVGGFTDAKSALDFISSGGTPVTSIISGGKISAAQIEHAWVEAYVDYIPSRGAVHKQGDTWIPLDGSFKQFTFTPGIDLQTAVPFDAQALLSETQGIAIIDPTTNSVTSIDANLIETRLTTYTTQLENYVAQTMPNATTGDILGTKMIKKQELGILPATLPYKLVVATRYQTIPDTVRHLITIEIITDAFFGADLTYTVSLPEMAGKRMTISYDPATSADHDLINTYADQLATSLPAYLVQLKPVLKLDGTSILLGPAIGMGNSQILSLTFRSPPGLSDIVEHSLLAGEYTAVSLDLSHVTQEMLQNRIDQADFLAEPVGEMLHQVGLTYWAELDAFNQIVAKTAKVLTSRQPSQGLVKAGITVGYLFGAPNSATYNRRSLDIRRDIVSVFHAEGNTQLPINFGIQSGMTGSYLEGTIFDQLFSGNIGDSISSVRILHLANEQAIPIYQIDKTNLAAVLPRLQVTDNVKTDIQNGVNAGRIVYIPEREITQNGWVGVGYILIDPATGAGAYMISGGLAGSNQNIKAETVYPLPQIPATGVGVFVLGMLTRSGGATLAVEGGTVIGIAINPAALITIAAVIVIAIILSKTISDTLKNRPPEDWRILRHYTDREGLEGILLLARLFTSKEGELGPCVYLTDYIQFPDGGGPMSMQIATVLGITDKNITDYIDLKIDWNIYGKYFIVQNIRGANQYCLRLPALLIDGKTVVMVATFSS